VLISQKHFWEEVMTINHAPSARLASCARAAALMLIASAAATLAVPRSSFAQQAPTAREEFLISRPERVGMSSARLELLTRAFNKEISSKQLPGAVIMVARKGQVVYARAFGVRDPGSAEPMQVDSLFRIYSMTKPMASVAAMLLVEDGILQPTDAVSKWLPAFKDMKVYSGSETVAATRTMTVQDLLRHTSGIGYGEINTTSAYRDALKEAGVYKPGVIDFDIRDLTPAQFTERLAKVPLVHQPGTAWEYSLSTDVLGRVVEAAAGKKLGDFLAERVYRPLRMEDTAFFVPDAKKDRLAASFDKDPVSGNPFRLIDVSKEPGNDSGGAGAVSTAPDYLRFAQMLLNGGTLSGKRIMSRTSIRYMASDHLGAKIPIAQTPGGNVLAPSSYTFGLGFAVRPSDGVAGTPGSAGDYYWGGYAGTYFWVDPKEQLTAVIMMQSPGVQRPFHRGLLRQLVYQAIID
jgi:CubicO group peptidase (beta-lactamase class C family)